MLNKGIIEQFGNHPNEIYIDPNNIFVAEFIGIHFENEYY